jgi:predicted nucleic acid-binding protein
MIVLDSDVLSTLMKPGLDEAIYRWLNQYPNQTIVTTSVTVFEIQVGLRAIPEGRRRAALEAAFERSLREMLNHRVLSLSRVAAMRASELYDARKRRGLNIALPDTLIAGIVLANGATLATGNIKDFTDIDARVVNPWRPDSTG